MYTVGIKRKFLPGFRRYKVTRHRAEKVGGMEKPHMVLYLWRGGRLFVPVDRGEFLIYPDYALHQKAIELVQQEEQE